MQACAILMFRARDLSGAGDIPCAKPYGLA